MFWYKETRVNRWFRRRSWRRSGVTSGTQASLVLIIKAWLCVGHGDCFFGGNIADRYKGKWLCSLDDAYLMCARVTEQRSIISDSPDNLVCNHGLQTGRGPGWGDLPWAPFVVAGFVWWRILVCRDRRTWKCRWMLEPDNYRRNKISNLNFGRRCININSTYRRNKISTTCY